MNIPAVNVPAVCRFVFTAAIAWSLAGLAWAQPRIELELDLPDAAPEEAKEAAADAVKWFEGAAIVQRVKPSSHWMGIVVRPADALLKKHLQLEGGLVVQHVTEDSPAAEAGIQADDILLSVNDRAVADVKGLMEFLSENKGDEVTVKLLRAGKRKTVQVTPVERPRGHAQRFMPPRVGEKGWGEFDFQQKTPEEIRKWIEEMTEQGARGRPFPFDGENPLRFRFFHPGVVLKKGVDVDVQTGDLPKGLRVVVIKQGDEPAQIKVQRGDDRWDVSEKELDKLPEDVREHVKKYLRDGARVGIRVERAKTPPIKPLHRPRVQARSVRIHAGGDGRIEEKLEQIDERLQRIEAALKKLSGE